MRRDQDLIRDLLLKIEASPDKPSSKELMAGADEVEMRRISDHLELMEDDGLTKSAVLRATGGFRLAANIQLTSKGHDFVDAVRAPKMWRDIKKAGAKAGATGFRVMIDFAIAYAKKEMGLPSG